MCVSGFFDPLHLGHLRYIEAAAKLGNLLVILNSDEQVIAKKGYVFMPYDERKAIIRHLKGVKEVFGCVDKDGSVCRTLKMAHPDIFAKGGDRTADNIPEAKICEELKIKMVFGVGGSDKPQSSSRLINGLIKYFIAHGLKEQVGEFLKEARETKKPEYIKIYSDGIFDVYNFIMAKAQEIKK